MPEAPSVHTIGHSDHTTAGLIGLLRQHDITRVVDVRSQPYSRWAPQHNRETLVQELEGAGIGYSFKGDSLGGRPVMGGLQTEGRPDYTRMEQDPAYKESIDWLLSLGTTEHVCLMCSEGDHRQCHRHHLIAQTLLERGARVIHITREGLTVDGERLARQLSLF